MLINAVESTKLNSTVDQFDQRGWINEIEFNGRSGWSTRLNQRNWIQLSIRLINAVESTKLNSTVDQVDQRGWINVIEFNGFSGWSTRLNQRNWIQRLIRLINAVESTKLNSTVERYCLHSSTKLNEAVDFKMAVNELVRGGVVVICGCLALWRLTTTIIVVPHR